MIDEGSRSAVGTTSFYRVVPEHTRLEVGKTWLGAHYRRTHINTAAKYLLLTHAFEALLANRVELNTDARNLRYALASLKTITIGTSLPPDVKTGDDRPEEWTDVPPASLDYEGARKSLRGHIDKLLDELSPP